MLILIKLKKNLLCWTFPTRYYTQNYFSRWDSFSPKLFASPLKKRIENSTTLGWSFFAIGHPPAIKSSSIVSFNYYLMMRRLVFLWISVYASTFAAERVPSNTPWLKKETTNHQKITSIRVWNQDAIEPQCDIFVMAGSPSSSPTRSLQTNQRIQKVVPQHDPLLSRSSARWMLVLCAFMYGTTYPLTKSLQESMHPSMVTALRFNIAAMFFVPQLRHVWNRPMLLWRSMELGLLCSIGFIRSVQDILIQLSIAITAMLLINTSSAPFIASSTPSNTPHLYLISSSPSHINIPLLIVYQSTLSSLISQAMVLSETSASKAAFFGGLSVVMPPLFELIVVVMENMKKWWWIERFLDCLKLSTRQRERQQQLLHANKAKVPTSSSSLKASTASSSSTTTTTTVSLLARMLKSPLITPALALCGAAWLACGGTSIFSLVILLYCLSCNVHPPPPLPPVLSYTPILSLHPNPPPLIPSPPPSYPPLHLSHSQGLFVLIYDGVICGYSLLLLPLPCVSGAPQRSVNTPFYTNTLLIPTHSFIPTQYFSFIYFYS